MCNDKELIWKIFEYGSYATRKVMELDMKDYNFCWQKFGYKIQLNHMLSQISRISFSKGMNSMENLLKVIFLPYQGL